MVHAPVRGIAAVLCARVTIVAVDWHATGTVAVAADAGRARVGIASCLVRNAYIGRALLAGLARALFCRVADTQRGTADGSNHPRGVIGWTRSALPGAIFVGIAGIARAG